MSYETRYHPLIFDLENNRGTSVGIQLEYSVVVHFCEWQNQNSPPPPLFIQNAQNEMGKSKMPPE